MARPPALKTVYAEFDGALSSSVGLANAVSPYLTRNYDSINSNDLHPEQARRVIALAFLATVSAWESFLEATFVRYLAGAASPSGYSAPPRAGYAQSLSHAYHLLAGENTYDPAKDYLNWGVRETLERAKLFFAKGEPYSTRLKPAQQLLAEAFIIRHRVVHSSTKARNDFRAVAIRLTAPSSGKLRQGYSVGEFLLTPAARGFGKHGGIKVGVLQAYINLFKELAGGLVP